MDILNYIVFFISTLSKRELLPYLLHFILCIYYVQMYRYILVWTDGVDIPAR